MCTTRKKRRCSAAVITRKDQPRKGCSSWKSRFRGRNASFTSILDEAKAGERGTSRQTSAMGYCSIALSATAPTLSQRESTKIGSIHAGVSVSYTPTVALFDLCSGGCHPYACSIHEMRE